jgi:hypothetical protein
VLSVERDREDRHAKQASGLAPQLVTATAAKRSPATVSALQDPAAKALVAVLPAVGECDRESAHESVASPLCTGRVIGSTRKHRRMLAPAEARVHMQG